MNLIRNKLNFYLSNVDGESRKLISMIANCANQNSSILDVGCGYGRNLQLLLKNQFKNVIGVELNPAIVETNLKNNLPCISVENFQALDQKFNLILMSHIIEHFQPADLIDFLDFYLDRLEENGFLVIATPLMSNYFYDDFDHIKPYHPDGISLVFGLSKSQVQYYSRNKLVLRDIWFRTSPYRASFIRSLYLATIFNKPLRVISILSAFIFTISFGRIGKKDGWIGVYQKIGGKHA